MVDTLERRLTKLAIVTPAMDPQAQQPDQQMMMAQQALGQQPQQGQPPVDPATGQPMAGPPGAGAAPVPPAPVPGGDPIACSVADPNTQQGVQCAIEAQQQAQAQGQAPAAGAPASIPPSPPPVAGADPTKMAELRSVMSGWTHKEKRAMDPAVLEGLLGHRMQMPSQRPSLWSGPPIDLSRGIEGILGQRMQMPSQRPSLWGGPPIDFSRGIEEILGQRMRMPDQKPALWGGPSMLPSDVFSGGPSPTAPARPSQLPAATDARTSTPGGGGFVGPPAPISPEKFVGPRAPVPANKFVGPPAPPKMPAKPVGAGLGGGLGGAMGHLGGYRKLGAHHTPHPTQTAATRIFTKTAYPNRLTGTPLGEGAAQLRQMPSLAQQATASNPGLLASKAPPTPQPAHLSNPGLGLGAATLPRGGMGGFMGRLPGRNPLSMSPGSPMGPGESAWVKTSSSKHRHSSSPDAQPVPGDRHGEVQVGDETNEPEGQPTQPAATNVALPPQPKHIHSHAFTELVARLRHLSGRYKIAYPSMVDDTDEGQTMPQADAETSPTGAAVPPQNPATPASNDKGGDDSDKPPKPEDVNLRDSGSAAQACAACSMFDGQSCSLLQMPVAPTQTCDAFSPSPLMGGINTQAVMEPAMAAHMTPKTAGMYSSPVGGRVHEKHAGIGDMLSRAGGATAASLFGGPLAGLATMGLTGQGKANDTILANANPLPQTPAQFRHPHPEVVKPPPTGAPQQPQQPPPPQQSPGWMSQLGDMAGQVGSHIWENRVPYGVGAGLGLGALALYNSMQETPQQRRRRILAEMAEKEGMFKRAQELGTATPNVAVTGAPNVAPMGPSASAGGSSSAPFGGAPMSGQPAMVPSPRMPVPSWMDKARAMGPGAWMNKSAEVGTPDPGLLANAWQHIQENKIPYGIGLGGLGLGLGGLALLNQGGPVKPANINEEERQRRLAALVEAEATGKEAMSKRAFLDLLGAGLGAAGAPTGHRIEGGGRGYLAGLGTSLGLGLGGGLGAGVGMGLGGLGGAALGGMMGGEQGAMNAAQLGTLLGGGIGAGVGGGAGAYGGHHLANKLMGHPSWEHGHKAEEEEEELEKESHYPGCKKSRKHMARQHASKQRRVRRKRASVEYMPWILAGIVKRAAALKCGCGCTACAACGTAKQAEKQKIKVINGPEIRTNKGQYAWRGRGATSVSDDPMYEHFGTKTSALGAAAATLALSLPATA